MQPSDGKVHEIPIDRIRQATCAVGRRLRRHLLGAAPPKASKIGQRLTFLAPPATVF